MYLWDDLRYDKMKYRSFYDFLFKFFLPAKTQEVFETVEFTFSARVGKVGPVIEKNIPMATLAPTMATINHKVALPRKKFISLLLAFCLSGDLRTV